MKNIAVFFGGKSVEHDISVITGMQAAGVMKGKYNIYPVYVGRNGEFNFSKDFTDIESVRKIRGERVFFCPGERTLYRFKRRKAITEIDAALICMHGINGEDGSLAGLLQLSGIPYTSPGIFASSAAMDKELFKLILKGLDIPFIEYESFSEVKKPALNYPLIVKPARLGSSIGISVVKNDEEFEKALKTAFVYDSRCIAEKAVENKREFNCAAVRINGRITLSDIEEPVLWQDFLTFDDKYNAESGFKGIRKKFPAEVENELKEKILDYTYRVYDGIKAKGVVRADFIYDKDSGKLYLNEINTVPGSLGFYLFEKKMIDFAGLIEIMVYEAVKEWEAEDKDTYFESNIPLKGKK